MNFRFLDLKFLIFTLLLNQINSYSVRFYENTLEYKFDYSVQFDYPRQFHCACINGLWRFYTSECKELITVGGDEQYCITLPAGSLITKAEQLLEDANSITIKKSDGVLQDFIEDATYSVKLEENDQFITGADWTLEDDNHNQICLSIETGSYCIFSAKDTDLKLVLKVKMGCDDAITKILPTTCSVNNREKKNFCRDRLVKRDTKKQQGRVFFGSPGQNLTTFNSNITDLNSTEVYDEDFVNTTATNTSITDNAIASEIWNFFDAKLDEILGLKDPEDLNNIDPSNSGVTRKKRSSTSSKKSKSSSSKPGSTKPTKPDDPIPAPVKSTSKTASESKLKIYKSPIYQFLELSKQVMQKTCPAGYVYPDFFNVAVSTFIKIQKKHFKFPEGATNYYGYWRITESLKACIENITSFEFVIDKCQSREKPVQGTYCAFGNCSMEINAIGGFENFDPLVETVWNVFKNAHAACFNYFNKNYNDHHRFTMWMVPLFQNQINAIWKNGSAVGNVYGGIFGNQENVQTAIAYCTSSSQMVSNYPWDLPRPTEIAELSNKKNNTRRKRSPLMIFEDLDLDLSAQPLTLQHQSIKCT